MAWQGAERFYASRMQASETRAVEVAHSNISQTGFELLKGVLKTGTYVFIENVWRKAA